jgi:hypothetical protein
MLARAPQIVSYIERCDADIRPPAPLIAGSMELAVVSPAKRNRELIAGFEAKRARLGEFQVMSVKGRSLADQTWLARDECQMSLVTSTQCFWKLDDRGFKARIRTDGNYVGPAVSA